MPLNDDWKKKYNFNPKAEVTMPMSPTSCPTVSPFERKPDEPKPSTSSSSSSSSDSKKKGNCKVS